jgi:hypothetical protein
MYQHDTIGVMLIEGHSIICFAKSIIEVPFFNLPKALIKVFGRLKSRCYKWYSHIHSIQYSVE